MASNAVTNFFHDNKCFTLVNVTSFNQFKDAMDMKQQWIDVIGKGGRWEAEFVIIIRILD